jgi:hypothetical protein
MDDEIISPLDGNAGVVLEKRAAMADKLINRFISEQRRTNQRVRWTRAKDLAAYFDVPLEQAADVVRRYGYDPAERVRQTQPNTLKGAR